MGLKPLKKFGQNYLTDKNIVHKMVESLKIENNESIIEIGPGKGIITGELYKATENLIMVEIDSRVIDSLKNMFPNANVIEGDFIKTDLRKLNLVNEIKVVGNIPFNQTGNILFKLLENLDIVRETVLIMPYDIAKRMVAKVRTKQYGILSVLFEYFSTTKIVLKLSPNVFFPKPNLDAAIVNIKFNKALNTDIDNKFFIKAVKAAFGNRRKTLYNSLRNSIFKEYDFSNLHFDLGKRAEELGVVDYLKLTEFIQDQECKKKIKQQI